MRFVSMVAVTAWSVAVVPALGAQDPTGIRNTGGWNSRFVPQSVFQRMLERPEHAPDALVLVVEPELAWQAMEATFKELGVPTDQGAPVGFADRGAGEMGVNNAKLYKRMGKAALSEYLRCGEGVAGPNADMYVVYLTVIGFVRPMKDGELALQTMITGDAVDLPNGRNELQPCTSSGQFEVKASKALAKRLLLKPK
ncbi:MAG: hypothetical protein FJ206_05920 [Gemmatimonadetes bacterium]|uniref:Uncharacterized protein n=1 Tax=Candidatus Tanganyikabacteria bacterium TaxID=2961651 RepID=A0A937X459_9BACT|nr:hypothetical protein [Candidatus Tanganyikabacteria bacterium]MBM4186836.1 hypothetical protein [Gemmatimonadota bacterium]